MKKILIAAVLFILILSGCKDEITDMSSVNNYWELNSTLGVVDMQLCQNGYLFALNNGNIYRSVNDGKSWDHMANIITLNTLCAGLNDELYTASANMFVSYDYGSTWNGKEIYAYFDNGGQDIPNIYCSSTAPDNSFYLGTSYGVFRSDDRGNTWIRYINGIGNISIVSVLAAKSGLLVAGSYTYDNKPELFISNDRGNNWVKTGINGQTIRALAEDSAGNIYAGGLFKLFKSSDNGKTWDSFNAPGTKFSDIICDKNGNIYAAFEEGGIYTSPDGGISWQSLNNGLGNNPRVYKIIFDRNGYLFAATRNGIFKSKKVL